jgi:hypothetical protein
VDWNLDLKEFRFKLADARALLQEQQNIIRDVW